MAFLELQERAEAQAKADAEAEAAKAKAAAEAAKFEARADAEEAARAKAEAAKAKAADSGDHLQAVLEADLMRINSDDSLISVRVLVNDNPEEIVDVDCTADVLQAVQSKLGIAGGASARACRNTAYQQPWQDDRGSSSVRRRSRVAHLKTTMFSMVPSSRLLRYPSVLDCIHLDNTR